MNYGEAMTLVETAVAAEERGQYERAAQEYFMAASALQSAVQSESSPKIQQLLVVKAQQVEQWATNLFAWLAEGQPGAPPLRM
ncbi:hypothetical protein ACHHYP_07730 [Achlya hypogyna]|uniref:MIT domain-containing protein n=1 Tax=Achlya hypogyna TaxID=1202772 RepID=A0A1V9ZLJ4_ACHHY|nr:hypothetical protein ACHHYP_07730 [Achlya hypogyna]